MKYKTILKAICNIVSITRLKTQGNKNETDNENDRARPTYDFGNM